MGIFCCEAFSEEVKRYNAPVAGGMYPKALRPKGQIEQDEDGSWNVNGCCGGGCFVLTNVRFCPFCGTRLPDKEAA